VLSQMLVTGIHALAVLSVGGVGYEGTCLQPPVWNLESLSRAPKVYDAAGLDPQGSNAVFYEELLRTPELRANDEKNGSVKSIFYEGLPYKGTPTRVFAYYGIPSAARGKKVPAMVLVHGGGGTAFESWVRLWNARGYAAIAMDTCGCVPKGEYSNWQRHGTGGPAGWGGFDQIGDNTEDQWTFHAVADVILAHSLLRSFPEVDENRIGITGISWGGYLTSIVSGVDQRFRFAVPVYGCGYLGEDSCWLPTFQEMGKANADKWLGMWDPSVHLKYTKMPIMWVTGTNDFAYPLNSLDKCAGRPQGDVKTCVRIRMEHGHGGPGENPEEIFAFANSLCRGTESLPSITGQGHSAREVWATWESTGPVEHAELVFTKDTGAWQERKWDSLPATIDAENRATATLPSGAKACFINLVDSCGLVVSSRLFENVGD